MGEDQGRVWTNHDLQACHWIATVKGPAKPYYGPVHHTRGGTAYGEMGAAVSCPAGCPDRKVPKSRATRKPWLRETSLGKSVASLYAPIKRHGTRQANKELERKVAMKARYAERMEARNARRRSRRIAREERAARRIE